MSKTTSMVMVVGALVGSLVLADIAEARKPRSSVDRRQRPGAGFWAESAPSRSVPSQSAYRSPLRYSAPQTVVPMQSVVRSAPIYTPARPTVQPSVPVYRSGQWHPHYTTTHPQVHSAPAVSSAPVASPAAPVVAPAAPR